MAALVTLLMDDEPVWTGDLDQLIADNDMEPEEAAELRAEIAAGRPWRTGGGAAPIADVVAA
jgi:hypothetical protein